MAGNGSESYGSSGGNPYNSSSTYGAPPASSYGAEGSSYPSYGQQQNTNNTNNFGAPPQDDGGLRRRTGVSSSTSGGTNGNDKYRDKDKMVKNLDFMFPKVDREFTVQTKNGGVASLIAYGLVFILALAELLTWVGQNRTQLEHIRVDTSLGKRMRVNMNITFPSMACEDLHVDAIDVAGDSQLDVDDTLKKKRLHANGKAFSKEDIEVDLNQHRDFQTEKEKVLKQELAADYCGPCFGAHEEEGQCCQTCDELVMAYTKKRWKTELLKFTAEQCIREGRDKQEPKRMVKGQGCNLAGYMTVNRVSGNFHIAMGEGIERDGRHIHTFLPEDAVNFNASHIIHLLSFGPEDGKEPLNGVTKIVTEETGTTGLFQYFIKIVPTTYVGKEIFPSVKDGATSLPSLYEEVESSESSDTLETNRYFFTERYRPLMTDLLDEHHMEKDNPKQAAHPAGHGGGHGNHEHHYVQNSVLPGVFFMYEIYPFRVEISKNSVPYTHLLIRLMATIGGVFTILRWFDSCIYERASGRRGGR
jgi:hypothetical protein